jgi:transcriptional regulator with XRE-family HTH domain
MSETFLTQYSHSHFTQISGLTPLQSQMEGLVSTFVEKAVDGYSFGGILLGGGANPLFRSGILTASRSLVNLAPRIFSPLSRMIAWAGGFTAEAVIFDTAPKGLKVAFGSDDLSPLNLHGEMGIGHGVLHSGISLLGFKLSGLVSARQSSIVQNLFQSGAMMASHQVSGLLGITDLPRESFAQQFVEAQGIVIQLWAGMNVLHRLTPGLTQWERRKDLDIHSLTVSELSRGHEFLTPITQKVSHVLAMSVEDFGAGFKKRKPTKPSSRSNKEKQKVSKNQITREKAQQHLDYLRGKPSAHSIKGFARFLVGFERPHFEAVWKKNWSSLIQFSEWQELGKKLIWKLLSHFPMESVRDPSLIKVLGELLYEELKMLKENGFDSTGRYAKYLIKISALDIISLSKKYPRHILLNALHNEIDPKSQIQIYQERYNRAYEVAEAALSEIPEARNVARTIASVSYKFVEGEAVARERVKTWNDARAVARETLKDVEETGLTEISVAGRALHYSTNSLGFARQRALILLIGFDPRKEVPRIAKELGQLHRFPVPSENGEGKNLLLSVLDEISEGKITKTIEEASPQEKMKIESVLEEVGRDVSSKAEAYEIAQTMRDLDLEEALLGDWQEIKEFLPGDSYRFSGKTNGKIRLYQRDLIQDAPVFEERAQLVVWLVENKETLDRLAGEGKRYSYYTIVQALQRAGKLKEDSQKFLAVGSLLEYEYQRSRHADIEQILPPSESFRRALKVIRRYRSILKITQQKKAEALLNVASPAPVVTPWKTPSHFEPIHNLLGRLRQEHGFTLEQLATLVDSNRESLANYEKPGGAVIPFRIMKELSRVYEIDVRDLIYFSNLTHYSITDPKLWLTPDYPIYLEDPSDLKQIEYYQKYDPDRLTSGWLMFSTRKNPFKYRSKEEVAEIIGIGEIQVRLLEFNKHQMARTTLLKVTQSLEIDEAKLIQTLNCTFYRDLLPTMDKLFPGQIIFIDPYSDDVRKIQGYAEDLANGIDTLGRILFGHRKSLPGQLTVAEMSDRLKEYDDYWSIRELNEVALTASNFPEWIWVFKEAGISKNLLHPFLEKIGIFPTSSRYLFAEAIGKRSVKKLAEELGFNEKTLYHLLNSDSPVVEPETILDLQKALPEFDGARFYRAVYPILLEFFPEASAERPFLLITPEQIETAFYQFDLREKSFNYRMDHSITVAEMAKQTGISESSVINHERQISNINSDEDLLMKAKFLGIDKKVIYLHFRPQILQLFPIVDLQTKTKIIIPEKQFEALRRSNNKRLSSSHFRHKLETSIDQRKFKKPEELAAYIMKTEAQEKRSIEKSKALQLAKKIIQLSLSLNWEELLLLKRIFPECSLKEMYEYFNHATLVYFLGKKPDGSINYDLANGMRWEDLDQLDFYAYLKAEFSKKFPSMAIASKTIGVPFLRNKEDVQRSIRKGTWREETIARVSQGLDGDRMPFLYFKRHELKQVLEADNKK